MIAVIFEVILAEGRKGEYLEIAAKLRSELEAVKGSSRLSASKA
jgi:hypothetical protein